MSIKDAIEYFYEMMKNGNIKNDTQQLAYETAIDALEKQIPKKPIGKNNERKIYMCQCGNTQINTMDNFCGICGQKLDWSE